jgi:AcrR family transcriptional regulator
MFAVCIVCASLSLVSLSSDSSHPDKRVTLCQVKTQGGRKYELGRRAERHEATRDRIVQATEQLHGTVGPAKTTVVDIARIAGVSRPTVYSHFPDERSLFRACGGHWWAENPRPAPSVWSSIEEPDACLRRALSDVYAFYGRHEAMLANIVRDLALMPTLREVAIELQHPWVVETVAVLGAGRRQTRPVKAALAHAIDFRTWHALVREQGLRQRQAVELMVALVGAAASLGKPQ